MTILAIPNDRYEPRLGVVISRKVARTAVARNRITDYFRKSRAELLSDQLLNGWHAFYSLSSRRLKPA